MVKASKKRVEYIEKPISHRAYPITGFVLSGWLIFFPGIVRLPDERVVKWEMMPIPAGWLKPVYFGLEVKRRVFDWIKKWKG